MKSQHEVERFVGISLGGAKSDRTCLTVIDWYRKQDKAFLIDIFESIGPQNSITDDHHRHELTADQVLLDLLKELMRSEHHTGIKTIAVDAPLTLPPCLIDCSHSCDGYEKCKKPEVKWMKQIYKKTKESLPKLKHFTPYSQRPVEMYFRYLYPTEELFQDETIGANLAPQAARMQYLKTRLQKQNLIEVWPKLTIFSMLKPLKLSKRDFHFYRNVEKGMHVRSKILEHLVSRVGIFIYDRDHKKLISNIAAFESFVCAYVALEEVRGNTVKFKSDLPIDTGWVVVPEL